MDHIRSSVTRFSFHALLRKISEMDIDEFMAHGFDSDVSTGDEEVMNKEEMIKHKSSLGNR